MDSNFRSLNQHQNASYASINQTPNKNEFNRKSCTLPTQPTNVYGPNYNHPNINNNNINNNNINNNNINNNTSNNNFNNSNSKQINWNFALHPNVQYRPHQNIINDNNHNNENSNVIFSTIPVNNFEIFRSNMNTQIKNSMQPNTTFCSEQSKCTCSLNNNFVNLNITPQVYHTKFEKVPNVPNQQFAQLAVTDNNDRLLKPIIQNDAPVIFQQNGRYFSPMRQQSLPSSLSHRNVYQSTNEYAYQNDNPVCYQFLLNSCMAQPQLHAFQTPDKNSNIVDGSGNQIDVPLNKLDVDNNQQNLLTETKSYFTPNKAENAEISDKKPRGKWSTSGKNMTSLYGVPSWWGDDSLDESFDSQMSNNKRTTPQKDSLSSPKYQNKPHGNKAQSPTKSTIETKHCEIKRKPSTAFIIDIRENIKQSEPTSLSSSLPSFQINDSLCSYFPRSRRMSLLKRESAIRKKVSLENDSKSSDFDDNVSENGTYVIDLDEDDVKEIDEGCLESAGCLENELSDSLNADEKNIELPNSEAEQIQITNTNLETLEKKKSKKKAKRSKTYKIPTLLDSCDKPTDIQPANKPANTINFISNEQLEDTNTQAVNCSEIKNENCPKKSADESLDTRIIFKEPTWNVEKLECPEPVCSIKSEILLSPKSTKVVRKNSITKMIAKNNNFNQKSDDAFADKILPNLGRLDENITKEIGSCLSTCRSIKTELLLKPTEEISDQLLKKVKHKLEHDGEIKNNPRESVCSEPILPQFHSKFSHSENFESTSRDNGELNNSDDSIEFSSVHSSQFDNSNVNSSSTTDIHGFLDQLDSDYKAKINNRKKPIENNTIQLNHVNDKCHLTNEAILKTSDSIKKKSIPLSQSCHEVLETNRSIDTGISLGQKIVQISRKNAYTPPCDSKKRKPFVPPCRKSDDACSVTSKTSSSLISITTDNLFLKKRNSSMKLDRDTSRYNSSRSSVRQSVLINNVNKSRRDSTASDNTISSADLSITGSSVKARSIKKTSVDIKKNNNILNSKKTSKDNVSCLTSIMKYSAQIQIISGNLLEFIGTKNRRITETKLTNDNLESRVNVALQNLLEQLEVSKSGLLDLQEFLITDSSRCL